jgi:hypothetical protein
VPRPLRHEAQRPAILVHPLAGQWPIASAGQLAPNAEGSQRLDTPPAFPISPSLPKPMDIPPPIQMSDSSSPVLAQPVTDASMEQDQISAPEIHSQIVAQLVSDAALEQVQAPDIPSQIIAHAVSDAAMHEVPAQIIAKPVSDAAMEQVQAPDIPSQIIAHAVSDAAMHEVPAQIIAKPVSDAAMEQVQAPDIPSQIIAHAVSDAAMEQIQAPDIPSPVQTSDLNIPSSHNPVRFGSRFGSSHPNLPKIQFFSTHNDDSRVIVTGKRKTHDDGQRAVTEKTRLVEQLDLTTRMVIENKDHKISELQAQV